MFSRTADVDLAIEPFSSQADIALFRIPLWMDLSMHAVPAVVLLLGMPSLTPIILSSPNLS